MMTLHVYADIGWDFIARNANGPGAGNAETVCEDCTNNAKSSAMSPQTKAALLRLKHPYAITGRKEAA